MTSQSKELIGPYLTYCHQLFLSIEAAANPYDIELCYAANVA